MVVLISQSERALREGYVIISFKPKEVITGTLILYSIWTGRMANSPWDAPALNHGSCVHHNKYQTKLMNTSYHGSLQSRLTEGAVHLQVTFNFFVYH